MLVISRRNAGASCTRRLVPLRRGAHSGALFAAVPLGVLLLVCAIAEPADGAEPGDAPRRTADLLFSRDYYSICDTHEAAAQLRADAVTWHIDIGATVHPPDKQLSASDRTDIFLPGFGRFEIDTTDTQYMQELATLDAAKGQQDDQVAIVLFRRMLTIEEVAQCLENDVRIYELLRVGRGEVRQYGAAIVRGTPRGLLWVTGKDFAIWIGPYASQYRFPSSYRVPEHEDFIISAFNTECTEQYEADLRQFGLTVANVHEEMHQVLVKGTLPQVIAASELPWVKHIELLPEIGDL